MSNLPSIPEKFSRIASICTATEVVIGGRTVLGIADARDLHRGMRVQDVFRSWIKRRIEKYGFRQGIDFVSYVQKCTEPRGGAPTHVYTVTLNMAKELAMVENSPFGQEARAYFLWCESELLRIKSESPAPEDASEDPLIAIAGAVTKTMGLIVTLRRDQLALETRTAAVESRIDANEARLAVVEKALPGPVTHMTVLAYFKSKGIRLNYDDAIVMGRRCSAQAKQEGAEVIKVKDFRYGEVNSYPIDILDTVFLIG